MSRDFTAREGDVIPQILTTDKYGNIITKGEFSTNVTIIDKPDGREMYDKDGKLLVKFEPEPVDGEGDEEEVDFDEWRNMLTEESMEFAGDEEVATGELYEEQD